LRERIRAPGHPVGQEPGPPAAPSVQHYTTVRGATEALCEPLSAEDAALQSMPDASPAKWHLAHTTWFFETFVLASRPGYRPFHPAFEHLFNSYYRSVGDPFPRPRRGLLSRPSLDEVLAYRRHVDHGMQEWLTAGVPPAVAAIATLGLQHEQQHQELLLTDVKHLLAQNPLRPAYRPVSAASASAAARAADACRFVARPGGIAAIGHDGRGFAFDNEGPRHRRWLEPFALADRLVTNVEWLAFVGDDGYRRPELWLSDGFDAVEQFGWQAPLYWERDGSNWLHFTLDGMRPLDLDEPVCHVSFYEADAFARWAGARLPGEDEWEVAAADVAVAGNFVETGRLQPTAVREPAPGGGLRQLFGDAWEWTRSSYAPYPGYAPPAGALGEYNGKFMSGQLVLRGGSCLTPRDHVRATYRNFFPPGARWQAMGVRLARDAD
jgi:ergothioneine biosynthesis protein EgtB